MTRYRKPMPRRGGAAAQPGLTVRRLLAALALPLVISAAAAAPPQQVLTGQAAYGGYRQSKPGTRYHITLSDMPAPYASRPASNAPVVVPRPHGAKLAVMPGFQVQEFTHGLKQPRAIRVAPNGDIFLADSAAGKIHVYRMGGDGGVAQQAVFADGLNRPYGIAFYPPDGHPKYVYVANTDSVVRFPYHEGDMQPAGAAQTVIPQLPTGGHWTRDVVFSPDGRTMFIAVGSASNVAREMSKRPPTGFLPTQPPGAAWGPEQYRADVLAFNPDGTDRRIYATGLRNCAGMTIQPASGALWCVVNERDGLGDNLPPDYATDVRRGAFYGWPWYYIGSHREPRHAGERPGLTGKVAIPTALFQPHSAPLGITFYDADAFPAEYKGDAFVAMHGSWNRRPRTGYKVVRLIFHDGKATGVYEDFVTGFVLDDRHVWGRPVDVAVAKDGSLLLTEDGNGTVWRVSAAGH